MYSTEPDEKMSGWLSYSSQKIESSGNDNEADILGMVVHGIGSGLKMGLMGLKSLSEAVQIKQARKFFALKGGFVYIYSHERAREAKKSFELKLTKAIEINSNHPKEFYMVIDRKCYRIYCEHELEC